MKSCIQCKDPMPRRRGSFIVIESDVIDGVALVIIRKDRLDIEAAGKHICGKLCLIGFINERLDQLTGTTPLFPARRAVASGDSPRRA